MTLKLKWLSNTADPNSPDFASSILCLDGQSYAQAVANRRAWLSDKYIGSPKATEVLSVQELENMGLVGVYVLTGE
jgi:hypothetical protein